MTGIECPPPGYDTSTFFIPPPPRGRPSYFRHNGDAYAEAITLFACRRNQRRPLIGLRTCVGAQARLLRGVPVVYVLWDEEGLGCYFGSTKSLPERLREHRQEKDFRRWEAVLCSSLSEARALEGAMLQAYLPYLNKRRESA